MDLIKPTNYAMNTNPAVSGEQQLYNNIKGMGSKKEQLEKVAKEFEGIFISKMFATMDKTVDRENGFFGKESRHLDKFKSYMYNELGRELASNPRTSFGFAKQIYEQMENRI